MRTSTGQTIFLKDYRPPSFLIERTTLDVALSCEATEIRSTLSIRPNPDPAATNGPLVLDGEDLELLCVSLDGVVLTQKAYVLGESSLTIPAVPDRPFELETVCRVNPDANTRLMGLYRTNNAYCTQCEAEGFRRITWFADRPDVLSVYTVRLEADKAEAPVLLSNGNLMSAGDIEGTGRHFAVWHDPYPKPSYLFAMVGGDLACVSDDFVTATGRNVALNIYVEHGKQDRCAYAMDALKRSMLWDEQVFGREYDLDVFNIVAVSDFNMGAMENKGLNVFNDKYVLARPDTATDQDYANIEAVIAHEYFHNWTGNRITCRDWFQLCLKEGLTVFRDQDFSADMRSAPVKRIQSVRTLRAQQFPEDAGPLAHPVRPDRYREINNFYTATVYEKGAEIIRMLKALLGADAFKSGMDLYFARHDGEATTIEAFLACFAETSGKDLTDFSNWYSQSGTPQVAVKRTYDAANGTLKLTFVQSLGPTPSQPEKEPMPIPIRLGLVDPQGADLPLDTDADLIGGDTFILDQWNRSITFKTGRSKAVPSLLRGFSAPIKVVDDLSIEDRLHLAAHDSDPFNRWQALQDVAMSQLTAAAKSMRDGSAPQTSDRFIEALGRVIDDAALDPAFKALLLTLPSEPDTAREIRQNIDPDAIYRAREHVRQDIFNGLSGQLSTLYNDLADPDDAPFSADAASAGRRALRLAALDLLSAGNENRERLALHYRSAATMTDRIGALTHIVKGHDRGLANDCLKSFLDRFGDDPLVVDKWFMVQATAPLDDTLDRVHDLMSHSQFSMSTPNRVRSLIGSFALSNQRQFNRADGKGYSLVADTVTDLDSKNPQIAARLLSAFRSWQALEPIRKAAALKVLRSIGDREGLSPDVREIIDRTLAE